MNSAGWFVLINPVSGAGHAVRAWPRLRAAFEKAGLPFAVVTTRHVGDAQRQVGDAIAAGHRRLLALGGDGAFHELVNGMLQQGRVPASEMIAAAAPMGTGNDWATHMGVPRDPTALVACLAAARRRTVDLGIVECRDLSGQRAVRCWFHNVCGAGFDAHVLAHTPRRGPRKLAYLVGIARGLGSFVTPTFVVNVDGREQHARGFLALGAVGPLCGGGMRLAPAATVDDGELDFTVIRELSAWQVLRKLPRLFDGSLAVDPAAWMSRGRSATIAASPTCQIEADGQLIGQTPLTLSIAPAALTVLDCRAVVTAKEIHHS